jgi:molybdate transport system substrate-binding protein
MPAFSRMRPRRARRQRFGWLPALALGLFARSAAADSVLVAVATNFAPVIESLGPAFERDTGHTLRRASGATGQLYAQILNGAPYDVLLAADAERPSRLAADGLGIAASQFTYAEGRLVLYGPRAPALMTQGLAALADPTLRRIAIANPALAPYGLAARQTLEHLGVWESLQSRLVRGENIGQAYTIVATGNAELGLVALSQVLAAPHDQVVTIPSSHHAPIRQDAILLTRAADNTAARAFLEFLASPAGRAIVERAGYATER